MTPCPHGGSSPGTGAPATCLPACPSPQGGWGAHPGRKQGYSLPHGVHQVLVLPVGRVEGRVVHEELRLRDTGTQTVTTPGWPSPRTADCIALGGPKGHGSPSWADLRTHTPGPAVVKGGLPRREEGGLGWAGLQREESPGRDWGGVTAGMCQENQREGLGGVGGTPPGLLLRSLSLSTSILLSIQKGDRGCSLGTGA